MTDLVPINGDGREEDRANNLLDALRGAVDDHGTGMNVATVVGTLHILIHEIIEEHSDG